MSFSTQIDSMTVGVMLITFISFAWQFRSSRFKKTNTEIQRLGEATTAIKAHGLALAKFLDFPDVSDRLKAFLIDTSDVLEHREVARGLVTHLRMSASEYADGNELWRELKALEAGHADAFDAFIEALYAGTTAALLRWPETALEIDRLIAPTQANLKREVAVAARAVSTAPAGWFGGRIPA